MVKVTCGKRNKEAICGDLFWANGVAHVVYGGIIIPPTQFVKEAGYYGGSWRQDIKVTVDGKLARIVNTKWCSPVEGNDTLYHAQSAPGIFEM